MLLSLLARSRNCYKSHNSQIKKQTSPGKAQRSSLMRPERRFSHVSSYTLKSTRINWSWNPRLFEALGTIQFNSLPRNWNRNFSRSHPGTESPGFGEGGGNPGNLFSSTADLWRRLGCILIKHRCPFTWPRSHLPPLQVSGSHRAQMPESCSSSKLPCPPSPPLPLS